MNRKTIITFALLSVLLVGGIAVAVAFLYRDQGHSTEDARVDRGDILKALPEDAAAVMYFSSFERAAELIADETKVYDALSIDAQSGALATLIDTLSHSAESTLRRARTVISLNYSGNLVPLMVLDASHAPDSAYVYGVSEACGTAVEVVPYGGRTFVLYSTSETLVRSASRHLEGGSSLLDDKSFCSCISALKDRDVILLRNDYAPKLLATYTSRSIQSKYAPFLSGVADWTGLSITENSEHRAVLNGIAQCSSSSASYYVNILSSLRSGSVEVGRVLPSSTRYALSLPVSNINEFKTRYEAYLDSQNALTTYERTLGTLKATCGLSSYDWMRQVDVREVCVAQWTGSNGQDYGATLVRSGALSRKDLSTEPEPYQYARYPEACFGRIFAQSEQADFCVRLGGYLAIGSQEALEDLLAGYGEGDSLEETLPVRDCKLAAMVALDRCDINSVFRGPMAGAVSRTLLGAAAESATLTYGEGGFELVVERYNNSRAGRSGQNTPSSYVVEVPQGPFEVTNCATGRKNRLYQNSHLSIVLQDENGKDLWGVPFHERICGRVEEVDYFANGKVQFLFAAGSKLYLMDRLSRTVGGFPVQLPKEVLLGPDVYDFTGAHIYSVVVLHSDNTIGLYDLHAQAPASWKGISPEQTITGLPEFKTYEQDRYWIVPTVQESLVYPFCGGERITDKKTINRILK